MEMALGNSAFWSISPEDMELDQVLDDRITNLMPLSSKHPDYVEAHIKGHWMKWAYANGDMTYKEFNGGEEMFPDYQKYHNVDLEEIKRELAMAQARSNGIEAAHTDEFRHIAGNFCKEKGYSPEAASQMIGVLDKNFYNPVLLGGHDETT